MENQIPTPPSTPTLPTPPQPLVPTPPTEKPKSNLLRNIGITLLAISLLFLGIYLLFQKLFFKAKITSYEDCIQAKGSLIQESYPVVCVTKAGRSFTQHLLSPSPDPTANWKMFTTNNYSFKYPSDWPDATFTLLSTRSEVVIEGHLVIDDGFYYDQVRGREKTYQDYVSEFAPKNVKKDEYTLGSLRGLRYTDEDNAGRTVVNIILSDSEKSSRIFSIIHLSYSSESEANKILDQILSTFKFTEENQSKIDCKEPRPEVCTLECIQNPPYICGSDGRSYCTVCQACANKDVAWYEMKASVCGK